MSALCVRNDTYREAHRLGIEVDGDARAATDLARLGAVVDVVAEIPRALRSGVPGARRA